MTNKNELEFDAVSARLEAGKELSYNYNISKTDDFVLGASWQFNQDKIKMQKLVEENAELMSIVEMQSKAIEYYRTQGAFHPYNGVNPAHDYGNVAYMTLKETSARLEKMKGRYEK
jgi:hypothetical protein